MSVEEIDGIRVLLAPFTFPTTSSHFWLKFKDSAREAVKREAEED
jgi:hypothetical protein